MPFWQICLACTLIALVSHFDYKALPPEPPTCHACIRGNIELARDEAMRQGDADAARKLQAVLARITR